MRVLIVLAHKNSARGKQLDKQKATNQEMAERVASLTREVATLQYEAHMKQVGMRCENCKATADRQRALLTAEEHGTSSRGGKQARGREQAEREHDGEDEGSEEVQQEDESGEEPEL